ncbi:hypothetical protein HLVA_04530 [Haliovirga abyssi]|uniref:PEGA domain-containing protein n=2 Tax=Haliovirga abyssi TaxID=2996794 RepID=A0AAU9DSA6_9FUSO|nr:hypothetical protein HLVA_04530 [Haliovirga abyssi]
MLKGIVTVEGSDNFGVFVYLDKTTNYDISDRDGKFELNGFKIGKTYNLIFQKEDYPEIKKKIKIDREINFIDIKIVKTQYKKVIKQKVLGKINSAIKKDIFINFVNKGYGIIVKPNKKFTEELEEGKYTAKIIQEGSKIKKIKFTVKNSKTNLGTMKLFPEKDTKRLELIFNQKIKHGYLYLYKDSLLVYSNKLINNRFLRINNLEKGSYNLEIRSLNYKLYSTEINLMKNNSLKINLNRLLDKDSIYLELFPENKKMEAKIYLNNIILEKVKNIKNLYSFTGLQKNKKYDIEISSPKYKKFISKGIRPGETLEVNLKRDIKGAILAGTVYPFNKKAKIMILDIDKREILAKTTSNENGNYEIELNKLDNSGRKMIRFYSDGFKELKRYISLKKGEYIKEYNVGLEPLKTSIKGEVTLKKEDKGEVLVIIKELNLWQYTKNKKYYFNNIPKGKYTLQFKKVGYLSVEKTINLKNKEEIKSNVKLVGIGKIVVTSNVKNYKLSINGKNYQSKEYVFNLDTGLGKKIIGISKSGYKIYQTKLTLENPNQVKMVKVNLIKKSDYVLGIKNRLLEIDKMIKESRIDSAELKIYELEHMNLNKEYMKKLNSRKVNLKKIKNRIFDSDRKIIKNIKNVKEEIDKMEKLDISYYEKRKRLEEKYKMSLEYLENIIKDNPHTTLRKKIYKLEGDIYKKLGMTQTAKIYYEK